MGEGDGAVAHVVPWSLFSGSCWFATEESKIQYLYQDAESRITVAWLSGSRPTTRRVRICVGKSRASERSWNRSGIGCSDQEVRDPDDEWGGEASVPRTSRADGRSGRMGGGAITGSRSPNVVQLGPNTRHNWGAEASARRRSSATTLHDWARVSLNAASKSSIRRDFRRSGMMASCGGWVKADEEIDCRYRAVAVTG